MSKSERVVVVGGGVVGIACAHFLATAGFRVTVIDQGRIGGGASHANCGYICPSHMLPLNGPGVIWDAIVSMFRPSSAFRFKPQLRLDLYRWAIQFARLCSKGSMLRIAREFQPLIESSIDEYRRLFATEDIQAEWGEKGLLYVFKSAKALESFAKTDELLSAEFGLKASLFSGSELEAFDPAFVSGLSGAYYYDDDASVRPDMLMKNWKSLLEARGVTFLEECRLLSVNAESLQVRSIETSRGKECADQFVFATGAWSSQLGKLLGCSIPVEPGKGYSVTMSRPPRAPRYPTLFPEARVGITPFSEAYRIGSMMEFVGFDSTVPESRIRQLKSSVRPYLHTPEGNAQIEAWSGWRPMTSDSLPIIGHAPNLDNAILATGHNMLGLTLAPATGRLVAELAQRKETYIDVGPFSPTRF